MFKDLKETKFAWGEKFEMVKNPAQNNRNLGAG